MSFNTVEDVNGTMFDNQGFWWYELDTRELPEGDITDLKCDFLRINRTYNAQTNTNDYTIFVDNSLWTTGAMAKYVGSEMSYVFLYENSNPFNCREFLDFQYDYFKIYIYMGPQRIHDTLWGMLVEDTISLDLRQLNTEQTIYYSTRPTKIQSVVVRLSKGLNEIKESPSRTMGYLLVKLLQTDFQFQCNQQLTVGEVNTVSLGTATDYKVGGDLVGEYETKLSVLYNGETIPVVWNESVNDYTFDLDLSDKINEGKVRFKVIVETNEVLNYSENDVVLNANFESIDTLDKLKTLVSVGGIGRLSSDLTLTSDLMLSKSVNLVGNSNRIDLSSHKIIVPSDLTFKAQDISFTNGVNSIQQYSGSSVDLTNCSFSDCIGIGSVIDCQVDISSLELEDDFTTSLTNCTFTNNDMCILHGGNLTVTDCKVIGKVGDNSYPFFLYQTDGNATLLQNEFSLMSDETIGVDLEFNTCIFVCGETGQINGYSHSELQSNNLQNFLSIQRNSSKINVTYYYPSIEDYVTLSSDNGYCHTVSGVDFVFKTNVTLTRGE